LVVAEADGRRSHALITLLALNGLRIDEALSRDVEHLDVERSHRVLRLRRKGGKKAVAVLSAPTVRALEAYLGARRTGPIFITKTGRRMDEPAAWRLVRRLARRAGIDSADRLNPHSLRHAFVTAALDAGVSLRDVQDAAGHADPRTTRRYDRARHNLDRHATYAVTAFLAGDCENAGKSDDLRG
jgi:integrase/recombinase XerD